MTVALWSYSQLHLPDAHLSGLRAVVFGITVNARNLGEDDEEAEHKQTQHDQEYGQQREGEIHDQGRDHGNDGHE